jgi:hypothetical protein
LASRRDDASSKAAAAETINRFGRLDIFFNAAVADLREDLLRWRTPARQPQMADRIALSAPGGGDKPGLARRKRSGNGLMLNGSSYCRERLVTLSCMTIHKMHYHRLR